MWPVRCGLLRGGLRGIYKGLVPTLAREVPGNALMFGAYEALKRKARDPAGMPYTLGKVLRRSHLLALLQVGLKALLEICV